jgi:hypothetical protein
MDTKSGMEMVRSIARGECNADVLAAMAKGTMKNKQKELERALKGFVKPRQQMLLASMLSHIDSLSGQIESLDAEIGVRLADKRHAVELLDEIAGVGVQPAQTIVSEIGTDMSVFPSAKHIGSWLPEGSIEPKYSTKPPEEFVHRVTRCRCSHRASARTSCCSRRQAASRALRCSDGPRSGKPQAIPAEVISKASGLSVDEIRQL